MTSTVVRDSIVGDDWIYRTAQAVPIQRLLGDDGQPTGDILTGPVRLAFCDSLTGGSKNDDEDEGKYGAALLFTPYADFAIIMEEYYKALAREFPQAYNPNDGQYYGVHSPFHDQGEKHTYNGFTSGLTYFNTSTLYMPPIVDS